MNTDKIQSQELREWAEKHLQEVLAEFKSQKASASSVLEIWDSYNEADWRALRTVLEYRGQLAAEGYTRNEQEIAVSRWIGHMKRPYSLGLEAEALKDLLETRRGEPLPEWFNESKGLNDNLVALREYNKKYNIGQEELGPMSGDISHILKGM